MPIPSLSQRVPSQIFIARITGCRHRTRLRTAIALGSCAALLSLFAGSTLKPAAARDGNDQDQRGRIRSEVTLVSMLASVLDKDGRPALGLTADQFEVYEEGVKQKRFEVLEQPKPSSRWTWL